MHPSNSFSKRTRNSSRAGGTVQHLVLLATLCLLAGCSAFDDKLRMIPTASIDPSRVLGTNIANYNSTNLPDDIMLYNVDCDGSFQQVSGIGALKPDLYVTIDVSPIVNMALKGNIKKETRNNIVGFMLYLSDRNADIWEGRVYARYKARKAAVGGLSDLASVGAGASALIVPPVAAGLSAASLIISPISDDIDTTFYSGDTVETMLKAVAASRHTYKNTIRNSCTNEIAQYDMFAALDQLRHYDSLVSFRKGLAYAAQLADEQTAKAENAETSNHSTSTPPTTGGQ